MKLSKIVACITVFTTASVFGISVASALNLITGTLFQNENRVEIQPPAPVAVPSFEGILPPAQISLGIDDEFDPTGDYEILVDRSSNSFDKNLSFHIVTREYSYEEGVHSNKPIIPYGSVYSGTEFTFQKIAVSGREISFETETIGGVSYKFTGHFPINAGSVCEACEYSSDVKGILTKLENGRVVATGEVHFYVSQC